MSNRLVFTHATSALAISSIRKDGFLAGAGLDFLGSGGPYGYILEPHDIDLIRAHGFERCNAIAKALEFAKKKYPGKAVEFLIGVLESVYWLDLLDDDIREAFVAFCDVFRDKLEEASVLLALDEDAFRPTSHAIAESFRLIIELVSGEPVHAVVGRFTDLEAPQPAKADPRYMIPGLLPREACVKHNAQVRWVNETEFLQLDGQGGTLPIEPFDYRPASRSAVEWLRRMTAARFVSLLMSALHPRGVGNAGHRLLPSRHAYFLYSQRFRQKLASHAVLCSERIGKAASKRGIEVVEVEIPDAISPEQLRVIYREIARLQASVIIALDRPDATLCGMPRAILELGLPCLALAAGKHVLDAAYMGRANGLASATPFPAGQEFRIAKIVDGVVLGFLTAEWDRDRGDIFLKAPKESAFELAARLGNIKSESDRRAVILSVLSYRDSKQHELPL